MAWVKHCFQNYPFKRGWAKSDKFNLHNIVTKHVFKQVNFNGKYNRPLYCISPVCAASMLTNNYISIKNITTLKTTIISGAHLLKVYAILGFMEQMGKIMLTIIIVYIIRIVLP